MDKSSDNHISSSRVNLLIIIDGNAILHRAYHALPPLTAPDGTPTGAVYGFASMLIKLINEFVPTHIAVAFDRPEPTFRKKIYKDYQAQRPKMEEALVYQVDIVKEMVSKFKIASLEKAGYEADDIIGTVCRKAQSSKLKGKGIKYEKIIIVTGDKDLMQLVNGEVELYMPVKGLSQAKLFGEKEIKESVGVYPSQITDYKALVGDSSDNYPGIPGIGPKTAVDILQKTGSVAELYKRLKERRMTEKLGLSEKIIQKLVHGEESAQMSYKLAKIKTDVPIEITLKPLKTLDTSSSREMLENLGFKSLLKRLTKNNEDNKKKDKTENKKNEHINSTEQLSLV